MLDYWHSNVENIRFLEHIISQPWCCLLRRQYNQGYTIHMGCHQPRQHIAGTWAAGNENDSRLAAGPRVSVSRMSRTLFVTSQDKLYICIECQHRVEYRVRWAARVAKHILHIMLF